MYFCTRKKTGIMFIYSLHTNLKFQRLFIRFNSKGHH